VETLDVAGFVAAVKSEFPRMEEQQPRSPMEEVFEAPSEGSPFKVQFFDRPPMSRFLLIAEDDAELVQVQQDLFALNWRRVGGDADYPLFDHLRSELVKHLETFRSVLTERGKGDLVPNWCEVTYVNHIASAADGARSHLGTVLRLVSPPDESGEMPVPEDVQLGARYLINEDDQPIGRLLINAAPAFRAADQVPIWVVTLTARLRVDEQTIEGALARLDQGHEWADRAFAQLTTRDMHEIWGYEGEAVGDQG
jgi:uncharacterized protein (TIGR04255 family)